ncbi:MAG: COX15/CtaA family protein, partial [Candidatus Eisenbacteria bacterium]|nr:COX15/CtaA family protein [Candidatus Eisenbacteria bacterium]
TLIARAEADQEPRNWPARPGGLLPLVALATVWTWAQAVLGGLVSSSHAGCACPDWPTCNGRWFPPMQGPVGLQMMHRLGGYGLLAVMGLAAFAARRAPDPRVALGATLALGLTVIQIVLGVCNVLLRTPVWLSAAHLGTAAAILALMVVTLFRTARLPAASLRLAAWESP